MDNGYVRWGVPNSWGAQTHPMGYRFDANCQMAREAFAGLLNLVTPIEWVAPPPGRLEQYARVRG
jgi:hypothetical protein